MSILIKDLNKKYLFNTVFENINYEFKNKKKYIIKGNNGVGKSTLIRCILNQIVYDGLIKVEGNISYCPDNFSLPTNVTLYTFIKCFSQLNSKIKDFDIKLDEYLEKFNMNKYKKCFLGSLSKGQKEKVNIINSLLTPSSILIMDEPFSGLDNDAIDTLKKELKSLNKLIIIVSHLDNLDELNFIKLELRENEIIEIH